MTTLVIVGFLLVVLGGGLNQTIAHAGDAMASLGQTILYGMILIAILWVASKFVK